MRIPSLLSERSFLLLALFAAGAIFAFFPSVVLANEGSAPSNECAHDRGYRPNKVDKTDPVRTIKLTAPSTCCGSKNRKGINRKAQQSCEVKIDVQYCHTQIINNVPITFCYWNHLKVKGIFHPDRQCCEVTLKDIDRRTYCVPAGSTITIGPIVFMQRTSMIPEPPPITLVESIEGTRTVFRYIPERRSADDQSDVYVFEGNRLFIVTPMKFASQEANAL